MAARLPFVLALPLAVGGCELAEVATAPARDLLVVESVLRAGASRQILLLHHSVDGRVVRGEPGAAVVVTGPDGTEYPFIATDIDVCADGFSGRGATQGADSVDVQASCYVSFRGPRPDIQPGSTYELRVITRDGAELRGRTTVPGDFAFRSLPRTGEVTVCALPPNTNLPLYWSVASGAWSYLTAMQINRLREALAMVGIDAPERLELAGVSISERDTLLAVPADLGIFELGDVDQEILKYLQRGFPAGVSVSLTVAAADRNFVNSVRGGGFNPSGNVRISSVLGDGVGVFGSIVPRELEIRVGTDLLLPSCLDRSPSPGRAVRGVGSAVEEGMAAGVLPVG